MTEKYYWLREAVSRMRCNGDDIGANEAQAELDTIMRADQPATAHIHKDECWEPDSGCDMGRNEEFAAVAKAMTDAAINGIGMVRVTYIDPAKTAHDNPGHCGVLDAMTKGELEAYDQGSAEMMAALREILDGKDDGGGVANEPWESLRRRVLALMRPASPAVDQAPSPELIQRAWDMYCDDTKGTMDVRDHWFELPPAVQILYIEKATHQPRQFDLIARLADAERIVRMVDRVARIAVENDGRVVISQGAVLFTAAANYLVKYEKS